MTWMTASWQPQPRHQPAHARGPDVVRSSRDLVAGRLAGARAQAAPDAHRLERCLGEIDAERPDHALAFFTPVAFGDAAPAPPAGHGDNARRRGPVEAQDAYARQAPAGGGRSAPPFARRSHALPRSTCGHAAGPRAPRFDALAREDRDLASVVRRWEAGHAAAEGRPPSRRHAGARDERIAPGRARRRRRCAVAPSPGLPLFRRGMLWISPAERDPLFVR